MLPILITLMVIGAQALPQLETRLRRLPPHLYNRYCQETRPGFRHTLLDPYCQISSNTGFDGGQPSTTPGDALIRKFDDDDDLPGDCTIDDFNAGDIRECASKGTYPEYLHGTFGISVPSKVECTHTGFLQALLDLWKKDAQPIIVEKHLDPLYLPDHVFPFIKMISSFPFPGNVVIYNGYIAGLKEFDICGHFVKDHNVVTGIAATATFPNLNVKYSGEAHFMGLVRQFNFRANITGSIGNVTFIYNNTSYQFEATDVSLSFGSLNFAISGLGPLYWIIFDLLTALRNFFQGILQPFIANKLKDAMNEAMHKLALDCITP